MKRILVIVFNGLKTDARVLKQIAALEEEYEITAVSFQDPEISRIDHITIGRPNPGMFRKLLLVPLLLFRVFSPAYWLLYSYKYLKGVLTDNFDLIIANDIETLPLALYISSNNAKVIFDAHEYAPKQFEDNFRWRLLFKNFNLFLCKKYLPKVDGMITQNSRFAREYQKEFGVKAEIITNAPDYHDIQPHPTFENEIKIIHHGIYNQTRKLERLIEIVNQLDPRFILYLMIHLPLTANETTRQKYLHFKKGAEANSRIRWLDPVGGGEVVSRIADYDIGLHILDPINFNHKYSLPNKILEFIQARLAVVIGPSPGMEDVVRKYGVGIIAEGFSVNSIVRAIESLSVAEIDNYKRNSHSCARELSYERNKEVLMKIVSQQLAEMGANRS